MYSFIEGMSLTASLLIINPFSTWFIILNLRLLFPKWEAVIEKQITFFKNKGCCTVHPNKALNETKSLPYQLSFFSDFTSHSSFSLKIRKEVLRYSVSYIISLNNCPLIFMQLEDINNKEYLQN